MKASLSSFTMRHRLQGKVAYTCSIIVKLIIYQIIAGYCVSSFFRLGAISATWLCHYI